ncbi:hypothetical protein [Ruegeria sp. HKCCD8929]|uniref:hypothetical protein n=1 Tax=Ruegeria sp. HKCCD8929 TaxID=2683006 RepID=UPI00148A07B3|nr:hypothetical protein [Ruegeria sp. HKCCD8929]
MAEPVWGPKVYEFVAARVPKEERGFNDHAMTAWQFGCMLICALGYANEQPWGASLRETPIHPAALPPNEDIAVAVLTIAEQCNEVAWLRQNGTSMPPTRPQAAGAVWMRVGETSPWPPAPPTVHAAEGLGPARLSDETQKILVLLGMIREDHWTPAARPMLWRMQPRAWGMDVPSDPAFRQGIERCLTTLPDAVRDAIERIATPPDAALIDADLNQMLAFHAERQAQAKAHGHKLPPPDKNVLRKRIVAGWATRMTHEAEHMFHARWRLDTGWQPEKNTLLTLFHDPLARQMGQAVRERLG